MKLYGVTLRDKMRGDLLVVHVLVHDLGEAKKMVMDAPGPTHTFLVGRTPMEVEREDKCEFQGAYVICDTSQPRILFYQTHRRL